MEAKIQEKVREATDETRQTSFHLVKAGIIHHSQILDVAGPGTRPWGPVKIEEEAAY
jgi:hypothetical protein